MASAIDTDLYTDWHRGLAAAALGAMLMLLAVSVSAPQLAGWQPNHGHATVAGALLPHDHPSDHAHDHHGSSAEDGLAFTFADDGSVASSTHVPIEGWLPAVPAAEWSEAPAIERSPHSAPARVVPPPPRG